MTESSLDSHFAQWKERETIAEAMIPLIGKLYREHNIVTSIYGRALVNQSVIDILRIHKFARQVTQSGVSVQETYRILKALSALDLGPARIDLGKLAVRYDGKVTVEEYVRQAVSNIIGRRESPLPQPQDVVLYGFGRIGRLLARLLVEKSGGGDLLRLRAIVVRPGKDAGDLEKRASLLRRDSVHGHFNGAITVDAERQALIANGNFIQVIYAKSPTEIDYTSYGIHNAILIDNTGIWRDQAGLEQHLSGRGIDRVLLTAPGKGDIKNVVFGINHQDTDGEKVVSAASCTTNAIVPVLKVVNEQFGVRSGHVETVHSYTNDQNLLDNYHKGDRRGRSAPMNMVITETGAAKAVAKALPELAGKLTGNAIRVPTPNISLAILNLNLGRETSVEELNEFLRDAALNSDLKKQIDFVKSPEVVSTDFVGSRHAGVVDAEATIVDGDRCVLYVWYDNEFGYSCQVVRVVQYMAGIRYIAIPSE